MAFENQEQKKSTEGWSLIGSKKVTQAAQGLVTIWNFHDQPIELTAFDQAPVSGDAELVVTTTADAQPTARDVDDKPGVLGWNATYAPRRSAGSGSAGRSPRPRAGPSPG